MATTGSRDASASIQSAFFESARLQIDAFLHGLCNSAHSLEQNQLSLYEVDGHHFLAGWQFPLQCDDHTLSLRVLLDENFPFSQPRIGIDGLEGLDFPHLERGSLLCLPPKTVAWDRPVDVLKVQFKQAIEAIRNGIGSEERIDDTRTEILAYWNQLKTGDLVTSLLTPDERSRAMKIFRIDGRYVLGDNRAEIKEFLRKVGKSLKPDDFGKPAFLLWLRRPPTGKQLPDTINALIQLILAEAASGIDQFTQYIANLSGTGTLILGFKDEHGIGFLGVQFPKIKFQSVDLLNLAFIRDQDRTIKLERLHIRRADPNWIFGRDSNDFVSILQKKNVAIIGIGSLGSYLAYHLASSGVGMMTLIDPEVLAFENISRHMLGADCVDRNKAIALAHNLQRQFFTSEFTGERLKWQEWIRNSDTQLSEFDLVISAIGSWPDEAHLTSCWSNCESHTPIMFTWLEPYALAGHSVILPDTSACFCCGFESNATPKRPVSDWPGGTTRQVPLCGGHFQPYGSIDLDFHALASARLAIRFLTGQISEPTHTVQSNQDPETFGGSWSAWWKETFSGSMSTLNSVEFSWPKADECGICNGRIC